MLSRMKFVFVGLLLVGLVPTPGIVARPKPVARLGLVAVHGPDERRVPTGHPVPDGATPFWANMPYSMARGGNGRAVPHAVIPYLPALAATLEIAHRLPSSQPRKA